MTVFSNNNIARAIYLVSKDKTPEEQSLASSRVVQFLARKRLLSKASDILSRLNVIINNKEGKIIAKVSSVERMNELTKEKLTHSLSKRYHGKTITLEENLNEKLLGGFKIEVNDEVIDFTIINRIGKLQEYLKESI